MTLINDLFLTPAPQRSDLARVLRDAQWWANLPAAQGPVNVYRNAEGLLVLSKETMAGTLIGTVHPDPFYLSGQREEWREAFMHLGDRRY
jgi:hypothetical protein